MKESVGRVFAAILLFGIGAHGAWAESPAEQLRPLVQASAQRVAIANDVAFSKWDSGANVEDIARENQVIAHATQAGKSRGLDEKFVADFFRAQIEANKLVQYDLLANWHRARKAPQHSPINLTQTIRPQLDRLESTLLDDLAKAASVRESPDCHDAVANAVGLYLSQDGHKMDTLQAIALDRSLSSFCQR
jgi:chorismate mutase